MGEPNGDEVVEIENTSRSKFIFPAYKASPKRGMPAVRVWKEDLIIGDSQDSDARLVALGMGRRDEDGKIVEVYRTPKCPSPKVRVPRSRIAAMDRINRKVFDTLVRNGTLRVTAVPREELAPAGG